MTLLLASEKPEGSNNNAADNYHQQLEATPLLTFELVCNDFGACDIDESACRQLEEYHRYQLRCLGNVHADDDAQWS